VTDAPTRLATEELCWLTTVTPDGRPQSSPVWFLWDGDAIWITTEPGATKVGNVRRNPAVAVHLEGAGPGDVVVSMEGTATLVDALPEAYVAKYAEGILRLGETSQSYLERFSVVLRVVPKRLRSFVSV
jgi:PPOX class probable F420-dependent enzyme